MENQKSKKFRKKLFYSVPVALAVLIIFLEIWGLWGIWKALFLYILPLFIGSYLLENGKAFGCLIGFFLGIHMMIGEFLEVPRRINMGNAGPRIEATPEIYWRSFWSMGIFWAAVFSLFFLALGIYVLVKNSAFPWGKVAFLQHVAEKTDEGK
ncbi:MAG: hypothetical protein IKL18_01510 [Oscillospiraceae bacterium]|nr:hypothetical protein [Oscillospiraceae bacterium]MBR6656831.1 hypothetical protein [Oscillospiraceae bacterium]